MSIETCNSPVGLSNPYDEILAHTARHHRLFTVHWELTYRCNERCSHCYLNVLPGEADTVEELSTSECLRVLDEMVDLGVLNLSFSGGEFLLRHDWFEIARHARSAQFLLRLFTNGIAITPLVADQIAALHPFAVEISLYSADPTIHERITGRVRSHELTLRALQLLRERRVRTVVKTPLMRDNVRELHRLETLARDLGAQFRYDITITPKDNGNTSPLKHRLTDEDLLWFFRETLVAENWVGRTLENDGRLCNIARNALAIDPFGNVLSCVQLRATAGNVRQQSLRDIWEHASLWNELGKLTLGAASFCRSCELRTLCASCPGLAEVEDGDRQGPSSVHCREALFRRQVLIEKGLLPVAYPVPAHLSRLPAG